MKYPLATETWGTEEVEAAKAVIDSGWCTMGKKTEEFEKAFAKKFGSKYAVMVNSGSSANLIGVAGLVYSKSVDLNPGDEVIVPAVSWSTSYFPLTQCGLKLRFVDVTSGDFCLDVEKTIAAITPQTKGILAVNLLGMPADLTQLEEYCYYNDITLIEDNCESMGASINGRMCGTFGKVGTFSTFFSHHICTIEGGMILTNNLEVYQAMKSLRSHGWTRDLPDNNYICKKTGNDFEDLFRFALPGYNVRPNEVFAAIGLEQLKKLDGFLENRIKNYEYIKQKFLTDEELRSYRLQSPTIDRVEDDIQSSWFGFGIISTEKNRNDIVKKLMDNNIACRPIVAGNFTKNPVIEHLDHEIADELLESDYIDQNGFFIGNGHEDLTKEIDYFVDILKSV